MSHPENNFTHHGITEDEFGEALEEALRLGGAGPAEIHEQRLAVAVDAAMPSAAPCGPCGGTGYTDNDTNSVDCKACDGTGHDKTW